MKIVITGHTSGIGKYLFEHYNQKNCNVIGMSRSNGYHIANDLEKIVNESSDADLFINNASADDSQLNLVKSLCTTVPNIVTMGTMGTEFMDLYAKDYHHHKLKLQEEIKLLSMLPKVSNMLLLRISFAETTYSVEKTDRIDSDIVIPYKTIAESIDFWLDNPYITQIDFAIKLSDYTITKAKEIIGADDGVNALCEKIENLILKPL